jgi:hypothetical protein
VTRKAPATREGGQDGEAREARPSAARERAERGRPRRDRRSRTAAVVILVLAALVIAIIGVTAGTSLTGGDGQGDSPPFSLLPITVPASTSATSAATITWAGASSPKPILSTGDEAAAYASQ